MRVNNVKLYCTMYINEFNTAVVLDLGLDWTEAKGKQSAIKYFLCNYSHYLKLLMPKWPYIGDTVLK